MDWQNILISVLGVVVTGIIGIISERLIQFINVKIKNQKYANMLKDIVNITAGAVKNTYQTYVEALKNKDIFDEAAQKNALNMAKDEIISQLNDESKLFINRNFGDVDKWIISSIESAIYDLKKNQNCK